MTVTLDVDRHPPELLRKFQNHRERWLRGEIQLRNYLESQWAGPDGELRPLWYPRPLGEKVIVDKAELFEQLGYRPSEPACLAHSSLEKLRIFSGGARAGKSLWGSMEGTPLVLSPDVRGWIVGPEYDVCQREFEYILEAVETDEIRRDWAPMLRKGRIRNSPKNGDMELKLDWGDAGISFVRCKSAERPKSLMGETLDWVMVVEASLIPRMIWERRLQMRLVNRQGIALFPSSPDGTGWYDDLFKSGLNGEEGVFSINTDSRMNPTLSLDEIAFWTSPDRMSDEDFAEQVQGIPTPREGRVYKGFSRDLHVVDWDPPPDAPRGRVFDFGYKDPYVILHVAKVGETWIVYREFYKRQVLTDQAVDYLAKVEGWDTATHNQSGQLLLVGDFGRRERIQLPSIADWDAAERADLATRGVATRRAKKDILPGIRTVTEHLRPKGNGLPGIVFHERCRNTIREHESYQWGTGNLPKANQDDHTCDGVRYWLHTMAPMTRGEMKVRMVG